MLPFKKLYCGGRGKKREKAYKTGRIWYRKEGRVPED